MHFFRPISILALCLTPLVAAGCRLAGFGGPVPAALANSRQLSQKGIGLLEEGKQPEAEKLLAEAVATCPTDQDARRYYAETLWLRGAQSDAVAQLEEAGRLSPDDAALRVRLAEMHLAMGRIDLARQNAETAIRQNPKSAGAWAVRGRIMRAQGDVKQALADFHRALGYSPDDRQVLFEMADVYRQIGEAQRGLETLQSLAETYSPGEEPPQVLDMLGVAYVTLGRDDDAMDRFTVAAHGAPKPEILCRLAQAQLAAGRTGDAGISLQRAITLDPQCMLAHQMLGQVDVARRAGPLRR